MAKLLAQLGRGRALAIGAVGLALVIGLVILALRPSSAGLAYLYTDLDPSSAQAISEKLKAQNIEFQLSADGTAILAPQDRLAELRMTLAGEQLGGKIGYEVLDAEQPFGMSAAREKMNETRAIEGELARSISTLQAVSAARVHIVMPDKAIFAREARKASAAVTLKTRSRLSAENIEAIRSLVAAAVPELSPEAVSIIDAQGRLLARAGEAGSAGGQEIDERQLALEQRLRGQIEQLLEPIVGAGKVRAEVSAELDRAQKREEARVFDPDAQVISRQISVESGKQDQESQAGDGGVTVGNQLPTGGASGPASGGTQSQSRANETSEDVTYDNSRTDTVTATGPGGIKRLSVAVSIDPGAKKSLPTDQMQKLTRLVENAVGYDAERGDSVVVEAMPFTPPAEAEGAGLDIMRYVPTAQILPMLELLLVAAVGLMVLRMVRSGSSGEATGTVALLSGRRAADGIEPDANGDTLLPALEGDPALPAPPSLANPSHMAALDQEIALAQVEGGIKASSLKRIGETIASNPAESASVIRQWMNA